MVPSPDWFIGVDSLDLCRGNHWIDSIAIDVSHFTTHVLLRITHLTDGKAKDRGSCLAQP